MTNRRLVYLVRRFDMQVFRVRVADPTNETPSTGRWLTNDPLFVSCGCCLQKLSLLLPDGGVFCKFTPCIFRTQDDIFWVFKLYQISFKSQLDKTPHFKYSNSLSKENSLKGTIGAKSQGGKQGTGWTYLSTKIVDFLLIEVWYQSLNPLPFKESFPKDF